MLIARPWTTTRYQALGLAKIWEGTAHLPNEAELWRQYNTTRYRYFGGLWGTEHSEGEPGALYHADLVLKVNCCLAFLRQWVTWLNNESLENGGVLVDNFPIE